MGYRSAVSTGGYKEPINTVFLRRKTSRKSFQRTGWQIRREREAYIPERCGLGATTCHLCKDRKECSHECGENCQY